MQHKKVIQILIICLTCACTPTSFSKAKIPVFPEAKGFGTETPAGRGGRIIKVTNLANSGEGSLRAAIETPGPRIIVFETSGTIKLTEILRIKNPYVTIAGQTAPSPGITLRGETFVIETHDVLIQHIRHRLGDASINHRDGIRLSGYKNLVYNVVLDHVSISWALDENLSTYRFVRDCTISNSIISEGLFKFNGYALLIMDHSKNISVIANLFAHSKARTPLLKGNTTSVFINNLSYNMKTFFGLMGDSFGSGPIKTALVGNIAIDGPNTNSNSAGFVINRNISAGSKIFVLNNTYIGKSSSKFLKNKAEFDPIVNSPPVWHPSLTAINNSQVEASILKNAGARPADRDSVDARIINEVATRTGTHIQSQQDAGGWPILKKNYRFFRVPENANKDDDDDGYTNIEEILHQLSAQVEGRELLHKDVLK